MNRLESLDHYRRPQSAEIPQDIRRSSFGTLRVQFAWREWQKKAGFDRLCPFHCLRHTAAMNHYRASNNIRLTQRFLRHKNLNTTMIYTLPTDEELADSMERMSARMKVPTLPRAA